MERGHVCTGSLRQVGLTVRLAVLVAGILAAAAVLAACAPRRAAGGTTTDLAVATKQLVVAAAQGDAGRASEALGRDVTTKWLVEFRRSSLLASNTIELASVDVVTSPAQSDIRVCTVELRRAGAPEDAASVVFSAYWQEDRGRWFLMRLTKGTLLP